jgi:hypothetical protein
MVCFARDLERERLEGERRRERDAKRNEGEPVRHEKYDARNFSVHRRTRPMFD